jgi:hypothetical protein
MAKQNKKQTEFKLLKEPTDEQLQGNQHDKIIKESIEETMYFLLKTFGDIEVVKSEQLPTEIQQTQERKPDFLKIITDALGRERIGHIEFHVKDEVDISYRAFETCAMMKRKKPHLSIFQIIVYMGAKPAEKIITEWSDEHYTYRLKLIQFIQTPIEVFLNAESAAEVVLGVLSDFGDKTPETVIPQLVEKVIEFAKTDLEQLKFLQHLRIFGKLRNFEPLINHIMENTIAYFGLKDEDDYMYKKGVAAREADAQRREADAQRREADAQRQFSLAQRDAQREAQRREAEIKSELIAAQRKALETQKRFEHNQRVMIVQFLETGISEYQIMKEFDITYAFIQTVKDDLVTAPKKIARLKKTLSAEKIAQQLSLPINWVEKQIEIG